MNEEIIDVEEIAKSCFAVGGSSPNVAGEDSKLLVIDEPSLRKFWEQLLPSDDETYDYLVNLVGQEANPDDPTMNARAGGWVYHLGSGLIKGTLLAFVITAALKSVGATEISVAILPAVLPYLFDLERAKLSRREEDLLITLHSTSESAGSKSPQELYDLLPKEIRDNLHFHDFLDALDAIDRTGHVNEDEDGQIEVRHPDRPKLRFKFL